MPAPTFTDLALLESIRKTLSELKFRRPTEIQLRAVPRLTAGSSFVGVAETGSGKTLAYALPILDRLKRREVAGDAVKVEGQPRALVLVPTRELGEQVARVFKLFTHATRLRVRRVLGGTSMQIAQENVKGCFEILVATPGRLVQLQKRRRIDLSRVEMVIFDEADQMLDESFRADAQTLVSACSEGRQMALFSATVSPAVQELISEIFRDVEIFRTAGSNRVVPQLKTQNRRVLGGKRIPLLIEVLSETVEGGTLIFTNTREQCDTLATAFRELGRACAIYRGEMDKIERRKNLQDFRTGVVDVLISTDLASRGLDVEHVTRVINYHMPAHVENYLHRVGRTARAGRAGAVINFITERDQHIVEQLEQIRAR